ncbi:MAG TPA: hypothetical protein VMF64_07370 [Steroidobacteraceae bacterium]|nr:hypothetical protein [Steroidobacteraceae bacterium]
MFDRLIRIAEHRAAALLVVAALTLQPLTAAHAGPNEQATRLFERLTGTPPSTSVLTQMASDISSHDYTDAANLAINDPGHAFYNVTIRNFAQPMSNKPQSLFVPLNDYTATIIGMVRDNMPFNTVLSQDVIYVGDPSKVSGLPAYAYNNDNQYEYMDNANADLAAVLMAQTQSSVTGIPSAATAGVLTTYAGASAYFYAGTNRAMVRFTMMDYLCDDLQTIEDTSRPPDRIRQDPSRSPGGDSRTFLTQCIGCHSGMDALAGAFAYYNFVPTCDPATGCPAFNIPGQMVYTPGQVQQKYAINTGNFPQGYVTTDDSWINHWRQGPNSLLGWSSSLPGSGNGAKAFGQELENTQQFATCQVQKAFQAMCLRPPSNAADRAEVSQITSDFVSGNYNLKTAFAESAVYCMGQ